jgi:cytoskeleton protein RodZ
MNAEIQTVGSSLKTAREAAGMTVEQAAARLRLMHRQVTAMEADDFAALGQPVFARGFVRNYARMLSLDAEALVERLGEAGLETPQKIENLPSVPPRPLLTSPVYVWTLAALIALIGIPVGLYLWLNSGEDIASVSTRSAAGPIRQAVTPLPAAVNPPTVAPPEQAAKPATSAKTPAADNADTVKPITPAAPAAVSVNADEAAPPAIHSSIKLDFDDDAWVEITEVSGRVLLHRLGTAGTSVTLNGTPPFSFVIGNAAHVRMTYNGRPLDLTPYIDVKVARFDLEE